jgi:hypothetical protein
LLTLPMHVFAYLYEQVVNNYLEEQGIVGKLQESIHKHMTYLLRWRR